MQRASPLRSGTRRLAGIVSLVALLHTPEAAQARKQRARPPAPPAPVAVERQTVLVLTEYRGLPAPSQERLTRALSAAAAAEQLLAIALPETTWSSAKELRGCADTPRCQEALAVELGARHVLRLRVEPTQDGRGSFRITARLLPALVAAPVARAEVTCQGCSLEQTAGRVAELAKAQLRHTLAQARGTLEVRSTPAGADVLVDGRPMGSTPYSGAAVSGAHEVRVQKAAFVEEVSQVEVQAGQPRLLDLRLVPAPAASKPAAALAKPVLPRPALKPALAAVSAPSSHALALRARWLTVPGWAIDPYLSEHTSLDRGWSVGLEYLFRRKGFDVVISLDYSWLAASDGNYLGRGAPAEFQTKYVHFDRLSVLSGDLSLIGHWNVTRWLEIRLGAGLGIGAVLGDISLITNNAADCKTIPGDPTRCYPQSVGPLDPGNGQTVSRLEARACGSATDNPQTPCYYALNTYPFTVRVLPVLNTLLGLRFRVHRHLSLNLDAGWRLLGFYLGGGPEFRF